MYMAFALLPVAAAGVVILAAVIGFIIYQSR